MKPQQFALNFRPVKPREADSVKATVSDLFDQVGGVKEVMARFNIGKSLAYAFTDETTKEEISFWRVHSLTSPTATAAAEFLASRAGGVFCALPTATTGTCPMTLSADAVRESGEAIAASLDAFKAKPTPAGRAKARKELEESICAQVALLNYLREE